MSLLSPESMCASLSGPSTNGSAASVVATGAAAAAGTSSAPAIGTVLLQLLLLMLMVLLLVLLLLVLLQLLVLLLVLPLWGAGRRDQFVDSSKRGAAWWGMGQKGECRAQARRGEEGEGGRLEVVPMWGLARSRLIRDEARGTGVGCDCDQVRAGTTYEALAGISSHKDRTQTAVHWRGTALGGRGICAVQVVRARGGQEEPRGAVQGVV